MSILIPQAPGMRRAASSLLLALASSACLHCATAAPAPSPEDRPADEQHGRRLRLPEFRSVYPKTPEEKQEMQALAEKGHKFGREFYDMEQTGDAISRDELDAQISPDDFERAAAWCAFAEKDYLGIDEDEKVLDKTLPQRPQRAGDYLLLGRLARSFVRCARYKADTFETCSFTHVGQAYFETLVLSLTGSHVGLKCAGPLPPRRKINLLGPDAKTQVPLDEIVQGWYEQHRKHEPGELPPITPWRPPCVVSPFVPKERFCGDDLPATGYTQFGILRLAILALLLNTAVDDGVEGSFVEARRDRAPRDRAPRDRAPRPHNRAAGGSMARRRVHLRARDVRLRAQGRAPPARPPLRQLEADGRLRRGRGGRRGGPTDPAAGACARTRPCGTSTQSVLARAVCSRTERARRRAGPRTSTARARSR